MAAPRNGNDHAGSAANRRITRGFDLEWYGRDAVLTELFLTEDVRGRGLGALALREAERLAASRGARALHLLVREENARARQLYASAGFVAPGRLFLTKRTKQ